MDFNDFNRSFNILQFKFDTNARTRLWRKVGKMIGDGIPIISALEEIRALRSKKEPMAQALSEWIAQMNNGRKLSEAAKDWVSSEEIMLLTAGEQSGTLPETMNSIVIVTKAKTNIVAAIRNGLLYPAFLVGVAFGLMYLFSYKIIPAFTTAARGDYWTGMARTIVDSAAIVQNWLHWFALVLVGLVVALFMSFSRWSSRTRTVWDRHVPYSIYRIMIGASWLIAMAALLEAGVRVEKALEQLMAQSGPWARVRIAAALRGIRSGLNLGDALHVSGYEFPDREIISDIRIYATKSGVDEAMRTIADEWIEESVERIRSLMRVIFGITLIIVALLLMFEVAGLLSLQLQLMSIMQQQTGR